jgi:orotidine 5'-phosphate decarboxylase subfamily 2
MTAAFNRRLALACAAADSLVCVGLDPRPGAPAEVLSFCRRVIDATATYAAAYKPNSAFFEALGTEGLACLAEVIAHVPPEKVVILDAKRGDIGNTADAYAYAVFRVLGAHALTVNPYLGGDAVAPFLADPARGAFVLCHTSNPGATDFQALDVGGEPLYLAVARAVAGWNVHGNAGLVVGATYPQALAAVRSAAPDLPFLVPGIGAQGGDLRAAVAAGLDAAGGGLIINSSRGILYADDPGAAARELRDAIRAARDGRQP